VSAIVWFRRDLRLHEHPALRAALDAHNDVVPVFCFDERLLHGRHASGSRTQFLLECLADLDGSLRERGSGLVVRNGPPERTLAALAEEIKAEELHFTADITPFRAAARGARAKGVRCCSARSPWPPRPQRDQRHRRTANAGGQALLGLLRVPSFVGERESRREVLGAPRQLPALPSGLARGEIPSLASLGLEQEVDEPPKGGEHEGRKRLERFLAHDVSGYRENRNALCSSSTSRLSPYLHLGCVSAREVEDRLGSDGGSATFRRQLCWRDFHHHVLLHFPRNATSEFQPRYRGKIKWSHAERRFVAWCEGYTGYPLIDAGMRQLRREGWMHNRARLVVGSFLTKDLGIDWRWGERHFMRLLVDGDEANNNGNWQWIASVGTDPQPAYRRIYNPTRQMEAHDPDGSYVRRYVPELRHVPDDYIREPWTMPAHVQREVGCVIGTDYPKPIVDHADARRRALERYRIG